MKIDKVNTSFILNDYNLTIQKIYKDIQYLYPFEKLDLYSNFIERLYNDFIFIKNKYHNQYKMLNKLIIGNTYTYVYPYKTINHTLVCNVIFLGGIHIESNNILDCANICAFGIKVKTVIENDWYAVQLNNLNLIKEIK